MYYSVLAPSLDDASDTRTPKRRVIDQRGFEMLASISRFRAPTDTKPTYCRQHAQEGMVDVRSRRCIEPSCLTRAYYGLLTDKTLSFCRQHAREGMVDMTSKR